MDFQQALKNPGKVFGGVPETLESSNAFDAAQKRAILLQWKDQLMQLQKATEENMPARSRTARGPSACGAWWTRLSGSKAARSAPPDGVG